MAAEVSCSSLVRVLSGHMEEQTQIHGGNSSDILITKDLLGSLSKAATKEIDLDFKMQGGGKVQAQRSSSPKSPLSATSSSSTEGKKKKNQFQDPKLQDLNFPPNPINNLFEDTSLDLKLQSSSMFSSSTSNTPSHNYQSVCTLDKVKFALERAEKLETLKKRSSSPPSTAGGGGAGMFAAACPGCLLYVIASNTNPRCPRCNSFVPSALAVKKKPRIDLNASF